MKLKAFQATNERFGRPVIRLTKKSGLFSITKVAAQKMGLTVENKLKFFHDEESPKDWYVSIDNENGFGIRADKGDGAGFFMNNSGLMRELIKTLSIPEDCKSFVVGSPTELEGVQYFPLLLNKL